MKSYVNFGLFVLVLLVCSMCTGIASPAPAPAPAAPRFKPVSELPSDIPTCSEKDANLNECVKTAFQTMLPRLKEGIKELNIPSIDPFVMEKNSYDINSGILKGRLVIKNMRVFGMGDSKIEKVKMNLKGKNFDMEMVSHLPSMYIEGNYKADMMVNELKVTPKGYFNVSMSDITMTSQPEGELYERNGHTYLRLTKFNANPEIGDMKIFATGLFPDPTMNAVVLDFVNQYWRQIYETLLPETRSTWEPLIIKGANEFLAAVPFDLFITKK